MTKMSNGSIDDGNSDYRGFVGPSEKYDLISANQFNLLTFLDLREEHYLLDIGCGSLRAGKLLIPYLLPGRYHGIEPEQWLIDEGIKNELGKDILTIKEPVFHNDSNFTLSVFDRRFDYLLAHSIFSHAAEMQIRRCLSEARKVMNQTSLFIATFAKGNTNYTGNEWVYPGFVMYKKEYMQNLFQEQGFASTILSWPHPEYQAWIVATLHESGSPNPPRLSCINSRAVERHELQQNNRESLFDLYYQIK